jgi:hypothetical protein
MIPPTIEPHHPSPDRLACSSIVVICLAPVLPIDSSKKPVSRPLTWSRSANTLAIATTNTRSAGREKTA